VGFGNPEWLEEQLGLVQVFPSSTENVSTCPLLVGLDLVPPEISPEQLDEPLGILSDLGNFLQMAENRLYSKEKLKEFFLPHCEAIRPNIRLYLFCTRTRGSLEMADASLDWTCVMMWMDLC